MFGRAGACVSFSSGGDHGEMSLINGLPSERLAACSGSLIHSNDIEYYMIGADVKYPANNVGRVSGSLSNFKTGERTTWLS